MIFSCSTDRPKQFVQSISSILWSTETQPVTVTASSSGFTFATRENQSLLSIVTMPANIFTSFAYIKDEPQTFTLNLNKFVNCARIFSDSANELEFKAKSEAEVELCIIDPDSVTTCSIRSLATNPILKETQDFEPVFSISIHSDALRELFRFPNEQRNASYVVFLDGNQALKQFRVSANGAYGDVVAEMPQTLAEWKILESTQAVHAAYSSQTILPFLHSLSLSTEAELKISADGILRGSINVQGSSVVFIINPQIDEE